MAELSGGDPARTSEFMEICLIAFIRGDQW